jgi:hypothetical protein
MPRTNKPDSLTLRCYNVGFGDCFLLTFHYGEDDRHVLIDFGIRCSYTTTAKQLLICTSAESAPRN